LASREKCPCFQFARLLRSRPSGVRGPVLLPPNGPPGVPPDTVRRTAPAVRNIHRAKVFPLRSPHTKTSPREVPDPCPRIKGQSAGFSFGAKRTLTES
jgi:hypothetical protein